MISVGFPTLYGWLGQWDTTSVPNGTYTLTSSAFSAGGVGGTSAPITITVSNEDAEFRATVSLGAGWWKPNSQEYRDNRTH